MHVIEVISLLQARVKGWLNKLFFSIRSWFFDVEYEPLTLKELEAFIDKWVKEILPKLIYTKERFDCDDFAGLFKYMCIKETKKNGVGRAIGKVYYKGEFLGYHAWNIVILDDGSVINVEPQTGEAFYGSILHDWKYELLAVIL